VGRKLRFLSGFSFLLRQSDIVDQLGQEHLTSQIKRVVTAIIVVRLLR
jgi:hypothetical protein